jgi:hypothetical protein
MNGKRLVLRRILTPPAQAVETPPEAPAPTPEAPTPPRVNVRVDTGSRGIFQNVSPGGQHTSDELRQVQADFAEVFRASRSSPSLPPGSVQRANARLMAEGRGTPLPPHIPQPKSHGESEVAYRTRILDDAKAYYVDRADMSNPEHRRHVDTMLALYRMDLKQALQADQIARSRRLKAWSILAWLGAAVIWVVGVAVEKFFK